MPIRHTSKGWYWGSKGPFPTKEKAEEVERAAYASGYKGKNESVEFVGLMESIVEDISDRDRKSGWILLNPRTRKARFQREDVIIGPDPEIVDDRGLFVFMKEEDAKAVGKQTSGFLPTMVTVFPPYEIVSIQTGVGEFPMYRTNEIVVGEVDNV